jgi:hypothetical protein
LGWLLTTVDTLAHLVVALTHDGTWPIAMELPMIVLSIEVQ